MKKMIGPLCAASLLAAGVVSAQEIVIQPVSTIYETHDTSFLQFEPRWIDGSGLTDASIVESGDPVPDVWPEHVSGYNSTRIERIRNTSEFETLTFNLGGVYEVTGMVLWNSTEAGQTARGFENTTFSFSTDGGVTFTPGESLLWLERAEDAAGNQGNDPVEPVETYAPEVQSLTTPVSGVTHIRMVVDNFSPGGANNIIMAQELRFTGLPAPKAYYVSATPTDWTDPTAWSDGNPATSGTEYYATNSVVLETPATTAAFPSSILVLEAPQRVELMVTGSDVITFNPLTLEGGELAAGVVDAGEARVDGVIQVATNSTFSGATDESRDVRVLSQVVGGNRLELAAPTQTIFIDNTNNTFNGVWVISSGVGEFAHPAAIANANIEVGSNGTLRVNGAWDGLGTAASLTVADSPNALVELGTNEWTVLSLTVGTSNVLSGFTYDAATLNAIAANPVFSGTGTIQIGQPFVPPLPQQLIAHWPLDDGIGTTAVDASGNGYTGTLVNGAQWGTDATRSYVSFDGTDDRIMTEFMVDITSEEKDFTWAVWVNNQAAASSGVVIGNRYPNLNNRYNFAKLMTGSFGTGIAGQLAPINYEDMVQNEWHHHAVVKSGSDLQYYYDGAAVTNIAMPAFMDGPLPFYMGGDPDGNRASEHANVFISDVALYNFALAANQVEDVMNGIYEFGPTEPTVMTIQQSGGDVIVSWPAAGFKLQSKADLVLDPWVDYPGGEVSPVTVPATNAVEIMRLIAQ